MQDTVGPDGLLAWASERRAVEDGGDKVFYAGIVQVGVRGECFFVIAEAENRATQRIEIDFAVGSDDAELVAVNVRIPADIHSGVDAGGVLDEDGGGIFDGHLVGGVGEQAGGVARLAEEEVHGINAMTCGVEERASAGESGIEEPASGLVWRIVAAPFMAIGLGEYRLANGARGDELAGANELGIETAIVCDGEEALMSARGGEHGFGGSEVDGGGFFAEYVLTGMKTGDGLGSMEKDWRGNVDGVDGCGLESDVEVGEDFSTGVDRSLFGVACDEGLETAARLRKDGRDDAATRDVADTNDKPTNHNLISVNDFGIPRSINRELRHPEFCGGMTVYCFLRTTAFFSSLRMTDSRWRKAEAFVGGISTCRTTYSRS